MPINCEFNLSRASAVYYTGEHVSGSITLTASKKLLHVEALSIKLRCRSIVEWQELDGSLPQIEHNDSEAITQPAYISYTCNKLHLEHMQLLLDELNLPPGATKCCNFGFELPSELPGNCRLPLGSTSYSLQVLLQRRGKHDKHFEQRLCVKQRIELLDLKPASTTSANLELCLPRSIYAPGQRIGYQLHATELATCHARLCQSITYRSEQPAVKEKRVQRVLDESSDWAGVLHLPLTAPIMTQLSGEPIEIAYFVEAGEGACSQPLRLPLWVGTVAPPVDVMTSLTDSPALGFVNLALCENDLLCSSLNQLQSHSCSKEPHAPGIARHGEKLKLLRRQKKRSYVRLALRYFYKNLLPAN